MVSSLEMARKITDVELQNVVDTKSSRKRHNADKRSPVAKDTGDHSTDPCEGKGKGVTDHVSGQNVESTSDTECKNSVNIDGEVVSSEFANIVEGIPTEKNEDKMDARPVEKLICNDMESGVKVNDNKEDLSLNNEEYEGDKRAELTSFEHIDSVDHNEEHHLMDDVEWYSLSRNRILSVHFQPEVKLHWLNGQFMTSTRLWVLVIGIEYQGSFYKYMIVLDVFTCSTSSRGTILELNPDVPCELMPNFQQRKLKCHLDPEPQRRKLSQGWTDYITSLIEQAIDGKINIRKCYPDIFQYHHFQIPKCTVNVISLPPRYHVSIPIDESSNQLLSETIYPAASQVSGLSNSTTVDHVSDEEVHIPVDDHVTRGSRTDAYAASFIGCMTDPQILDQSIFEMRVSRLGDSRPLAVIAQETDQQATYIHDFRTSQNESRAICTREINNLPVPALPAIISSRSSEGPSQTTGSKFAQLPSADLRRQGDSSQTTDLYPNISTNNHSSACRQEYNDTRKEVVPSETGSASVDDSRSPWDAPRTPGIFNIKKSDHCTQKEVAALKESKAVEPTKNQQKVSADTGTKKEQSPKKPDYSEKNKRIASFRNWSPELKQPEEMADCGFYYTGVHDCVCCFHCGILLHKWKREDNPWIEHARHSPKCRYVLMMKGGKFISQAAMMTKEREEAERNSGGGNQAPEHNEATPAVSSKEGHQTTGDNKSEQSQRDLQTIQREHRELCDATLCKICMENTISVIFLPCCHLVTCGDCAPAMRKCPICRALIKGRVKKFHA